MSASPENSHIAPSDLPNPDPLPPNNNFDLANQVCGAINLPVYRLSEQVTRLSTALDDIQRAINSLNSRFDDIDSRFGEFQVEFRAR
jgi:hypothetical protein